MDRLRSGMRRRLVAATLIMIAWCRHRTKLNQHQLIELLLLLRCCAVAVAAAAAVVVVAAAAAVAVAAAAAAAAAGAATAAAAATPTPTPTPLAVLVTARELASNASNPFMAAVGLQEHIPRS